MIFISKESSIPVLKSTDPDIPFLEIYPKETLAKIQIDIYTRLLTVVLPETAKDWKYLK